jgi:capsid protein
VKTERLPAVSPRTGLPIVLHGFAPEYAGQGRGYSPLAHAIHEFEMLTTFTTAQIEKAILQSSISMVVEPKDGIPGLNPFADMGSGPSSMYEAPVAPSDTTTDSLGVNYSEINDVNLRPGSVGVFNMESGKLVPFPSTAPGDSFGSFVESFVGHLAASVNMPPELLMLKFSSNYSASRAALILFWRTACIERDEEASDFYNPIFRAWLHGEIASGRISAPGWSDPRLRAAWCLCSWNGPPMPSIDPSKTARADMDYIQMGAQTLDAVARNFNGSSGSANRAKNAVQIKELTKVPWATGGAAPAPSPAGAVGGAVPGRASAPSTTSPDTDQDDDADEDRDEDQE